MRLFLAVILGTLVSISAHAATVTFNYTESFGAVSPDGPAPWATSVIEDIAQDTVRLTMSVADTVGQAVLTGMYFSLVDDSQSTLDGLDFTYVSGSGPAASQVLATTDGFMADGDGSYDILFDFPPPPGPPSFGFGDTVVYEITGGGLDALDFNVFGTPGPGGNPGPFLSVARFQSTGPSGGDSDWVGAVPVPAAVWLFGSGLLGLVGVARRKKA